MRVETLTVPEVAEALSRTPRAIYHWIEKGTELGRWFKTIDGVATIRKSYVDTYKEARGIK